MWLPKHLQCSTREVYSSSSKNGRFVLVEETARQVLNKEQHVDGEQEENEASQGAAVNLSTLNGMRPWKMDDGSFDFFCLLNHFQISSTLINFTSKTFNDPFLYQWGKTVLSLQLSGQWPRQLHIMKVDCKTELYGDCHKDRVSMKRILVPHSHAGIVNFVGRPLGRECKCTTSPGIFCVRTWIFYSIHCWSRGICHQTVFENPNKKGTGLFEIFFEKKIWSIMNGLFQHLQVQCPK